MNPYDILGVPSSASDDEVKKAYRSLSKKYHPDANIGNPHQEEYTEKFKQVQTAYKTIMDDRKRGFTNRTYTNQSQSYDSGYSSSFTGTDEEAYREAAGFIQAQRFSEAMGVLNGIRNRTDVWFYYAAICEQGLGNPIAAQEYASTAYNMNPMNLQYLILLQQLTGGQRAYTTTSQGYGRTMSPFSCCYALMCLRCLGCC